MKVTIPVKSNEIKEYRLANLSAIFGPKGIKAMEVLKKFDGEIAGLGYKDGTPIIVKVHVSVSIKSGKADDYKLYVNTPTISHIVKNLLGVETLSTKPGKNIVHTVNESFLNEVYTQKYTDRNTFLKEGRIKSIIGTLNSMGIAVKK